MLACSNHPGPWRQTPGVETAIADVTWQQDLTTRARPVSTAIGAGLLMGGLIGGVGGRLSMFVLRLTSAPSLHGVETDDGFTIGVFSGATLFLVIMTCVLGMLGGILYLVVRTWLPVAWRTGLTGVFGGIVGGTAVIRPGGIDFTLLDPLPLAIVMFVGLPAIYGVAMSRLVERRLNAEIEPRGWPASLLGLVPLVLLGFVGFVGLAVAVVMSMLFVLHRAAPEVTALWRSTSVVWIGRAALLGVTGVAFAGLIRDVVQVL